MTRKDYEEFARVFQKALADADLDSEWDLIHSLIEDVVEIFEDDNSRFNSDTFWAAVMGDD